ncbi:hypothetical protein NESM_000160100 [Novymonas esmeraldas]|uniref:Uncharacterized protein n=1 Tax=Novymonas esmeraldas TaxID=1808958 RepID=A0AAW0F5I4_9TRYP
MPVSEHFFEALFGFPETDYVTTRDRLVNQCVFEVVRAAAAAPLGGRLRVVKERALFHHPHIAGGRLVSSGWHSTPSVAELRAETATAVRTFEQRHPGLLATAVATSAGVTAPSAMSPVSCAHVTGEASELHRRHPHGLFQAASQFNLLEFISPDVTPEHGVRHYVHDHTQGPACALACMGGTAYRNYLLHPDMVDISTTAYDADDVATTSRGQRSDHQVNVLEDVTEYLTCARGGVPALPRTHFFSIRNGYFFRGQGVGSLPDRLRCIAEAEGSSTQAVAEALLSRLRIGVVEDATVTLPLHDRSAAAAEVATHDVTQTFNSALSLPVKAVCTPREWDGITSLSTILLSGTYEATLLVGVQHTLRHLERQATAARTSPPSLPPIFLTKVGGGVFNNEEVWIASGIASAAQRVAALGVPLDVRLVHFGRVEPFYTAYFPSWPVLS